MNPNKEYNRECSRKILADKGIKFISLNNDLHWKIGTMDYYPTTLRWNDNYKNINGIGLDKMLSEIKQEVKSENIKKLTIQQIAKIFLNNKKTLMENCEILHKEIYG